MEQSTWTQKKINRESMDFHLNFDSVINIKKAIKSDEEANKIISALKEGLNDRVIKLEKQENEDHETNHIFRIGVTFDPNHILDNVIKGPPADQDEAKQFREFWKEKAELRRFQSGHVCEAVYWDSGTLFERRKIFGKMVKHILQKHCNIPSSSIRITGPQADQLIYMKEIIYSDVQSVGTGEEETSKLLKSYDSLTKKLRNLDDIPLKVTGIYGTSPSLRGSEVFPPLGGSSPFYPKDKFTIINGCWSFNLDANEMYIPRFISCENVILNLETSGKWPDDLEALRKLKTSFFIQIAKTLSTKYNLISSIQRDCLDVFHEGYVFRLHIYSRKELALLRRFVNPEKIIKQIKSKKANELEKLTDIVPRLASALHGLSQQNPSYNVAVRLAKRWFCAQMLTDYVDEIVLELIMAHVYIHSHPMTEPNSPVLGFLRFLHLIGEFDWKTAPFIVNFNSELTSTQIEDLNFQFKQRREEFPAMFIATPFDPDQLSIWTKQAPTPVILVRLITLVKSALETYSYQLLNPWKTDFKTIFRPPLDFYDAVIHLNTNYIINLQQAVDIPTNTRKIKIEPFTSKNKKNWMPIFNFNPVQLFIKSLRESYSIIALFFYDKYGGTKIGVLFKPGTFDHHSLQCANETGSKKAVEPVDLEKTIEDFKLLGSDLVENIEVNLESC